MKGVGGGLQCQGGDQCLGASTPRSSAMPSSTARTTSRQFSRCGAMGRFMQRHIPPDDLTGVTKISGVRWVARGGAEQDRSGAGGWGGKACSGVSASGCRRNIQNVALLAVALLFAACTGGRCLLQGFTGHGGGAASVGGGARRRQGPGEPLPDAYPWGWSCKCGRRSATVRPSLPPSLPPFLPPLFRGVTSSSIRPAWRAPWVPCSGSRGLHRRRWRRPAGRSSSGGSSGRAGRWEQWAYSW